MNDAISELLRTLQEKFLPFAAVGIFCTFVDFGTTYLMKEKLKLHKYVANAIGFVVSVTVSYLLNRNFVWHSHDPFWFEYIKYISVYIAGLAINTIVIYFASRFLDDKYPGKKKRNFYISKAFATGIVLFWNFFVTSAFTFRYSPSLKK